MSATEATTTSHDAHQENAAAALNLSNIPDEEIIWTPRQIQQLIRAFRNEPLLWDVHLRTPQYIKRRLRSAAWNRISFLLKVSRNECERKMRSLLAQYRRERIRQNRIRAGLLTRRKRKWFGYDWFEFITKMHTHQLQSQRGDLILKTKAGDSPSPTLDELAQVTFDQDSNHSRRDTFQLPDNNGIAWVIAPKHHEANTSPSQPMEQDLSEDECDDEKLGESSSNPTEMLDLAIWSYGSMERSKERAAAIKEEPSSSPTSSMSSQKVDERSCANKLPKKEKIIMLDNEKQFATSRRNQKVVMLPPPEPQVIRTCNIAPTSVAKKPPPKVIFISPPKQLTKKVKKSRLKNKIFRASRTVLQQNVPSGFPKCTVKKICDNDKYANKTIIIHIICVKDEPIDGDSETVPTTLDTIDSAAAPNIGYPIVIHAQDYPRIYTPEEWERKQQLELARQSKEQDSSTLDSKQERQQYLASNKETMFRMHYNHASTSCIPGASGNVSSSHSLGNLIVNKQDINRAPRRCSVDVRDSKSVGSGAGATSTNSQPNKPKASPAQLAPNCNGFVPLFMLATEDSPPGKSAESSKQQQPSAHFSTVKVGQFEDLSGGLQSIFQTDEQVWPMSLSKVCTIGGQSVLLPSDDEAPSPDSLLGSPTHHDTGKLVPDKFSLGSYDHNEYEGGAFEPEVVLDILTPAASPPEPSCDPEDIFSQYVVSTLCRMPKCKRKLCYDKIYEILNKPNILKNLSAS